MDRCEPRPVAFWLLPAEPARSHLSALIEHFAARFDSAVFEPHLTVHGDLTLSLEEAERHLAALAQGTPVLSLPVIGVDGTPSYFKSFFLALGGHPALSQLTASIRANFAPDSRYCLQPHLSLLYASLAPEERATLLQAFRPDLATISFDTLVLAMPGNAEQGWAEVANWQTPLRHPLAGPGYMP